MIRYRNSHRTPSVKRVRSGALAGCIAASLAMAIASGTRVRAEGDGAGIDSTREMIDKWVETRRLISREKRDFKLGREMLKERIDIIHREIDSLKEKITSAEASISDADTKRVALMMENERLKSVSHTLSATVVALEYRTKALLKRLPDPLVELVKPLSIRLPDNPEESKFSLAERYQNVIGILNAVNKYNRQISMVSEVRELTDGSSAEVIAVYIGIGQGYYANASGTIAGVGYATAESWHWAAANESAPQIIAVIDILKNEKVAAFVHLPITIDQE